MIEDCSVTNGMARAARRMTEEPMKLIGIILAKHQEAILEVCKEQQDEITRLKALVIQCKEFIDTLEFSEDDTEQQALLAAIEKDGL